MQDFRNLTIWKESYDFTLRVYEVLRNFPSEERFAISDQLKRASLSICLNISEGAGRSSGKDFSRFLYNSMGSAKECECLLMFARDLKFITLEKFNEMNESLTSLQKQITCLIKKVNPA